MAKKISLPETIIMVMIVGGADLFNLMATPLIPVPIIGQIAFGMSWLFGFIALAIVQLWLILKGGISASRQLAVLAGNLAEFIPGISILPVGIVTLLITIYLINNPKIQQVAALAKGKLK